MKINEIITEGQKLGEIPPGHEEATAQGIHLFIDPDGWDNDHHLERVMRAVAAADGKDNEELKKVDNNSFVGKYNIAYPYTKEESKMVGDVFKHLGTDWRDQSKEHRSREQKEVHKTSPLQSRGPIKLNKK
jgi:hypothetical protein